MSAFLTGCQARKTHGADIRVGMSADQHVAQAIGDKTRFPSLELGIERGGSSGNCDSGYSCAYSHNLSWRGESTPELEGSGSRKPSSSDSSAATTRRKSPPPARRRELYNKSILDFVMEDAKGLEHHARAAATRGSSTSTCRACAKWSSRFRSASRDRRSPRRSRTSRCPECARRQVLARARTQDHVRLMCDLMVIAFQTDLTRVVTLPFANEGSNRGYKMIEVPEGHHDLSHHGGDAEEARKDREDQQVPHGTVRVPDRQDEEREGAERRHPTATT